MGDHKRGTFEERKALAIARQKDEAKSKAVRMTEIEASKSPEQRRREHKMMGLMMLLGMSFQYKLPPYLRSLDGRNWILPYM